MKRFFHRWNVIILIFILIIVCCIGIPSKNTPNNKTSSISDTDNGKTITLSRGAIVKVVLHSSYWNFSSVNNNVLQQLSEPAFTPDPSNHIIGMGTGTLIVEYKAVGIGKTDISASRTSCGEASRCIGNQGSYLVHITVF